MSTDGGCAYGYDLIKNALKEKRVILCMHRNERLRLCPQVLGWNVLGGWQGLFYQQDPLRGSGGSVSSSTSTSTSTSTGGSSSAAPGGAGPGGSGGTWSCFDLQDLSCVEVVDGVWQTGPDWTRPVGCCAKVDVDARYDSALW